MSVACTSRRGFVLPAVILFVVLVGAIASIMLQRHVAHHKTVQRQIVAYQEHHGVRSLQTAIEAWRKSPTAQPRSLEEHLDPDGLAFTLEPGDNTRIELSLFPGQGTMLRRTGILRGESRVDAENALALLFEAVPNPEQREPLLRDAGPPGVDVNTADPAVLSAIIRGVLGDSGEAGQYERELLDARLAGDDIGLQTLSNIATEAGVEQEMRGRLGRLLTVTPELWRFRIDVRGTGVAAGAGLVSQYGGLILLGEVSPTTQGIFEEPTPFLTWEKLNPDDSRSVE